MRPRAGQKDLKMLQCTVPLLAISDRQDLYSIAYIRAIVAAAGFHFSNPELDRNSDDLHIELLVKDDFEPIYPRLILQVKCSYAHNIGMDNYIHYPLPVRNYNHLIRTKIEPRILVVVHVPNPTSEPWVEIQNGHTIFRYKAYWVSLMGCPETPNGKTITVKVPTSNLFNVDAVKFLMEQMVAQGNKNL
jgi:hypothetical protein